MLLKRILKITGISLAVIIAAAASIPYFFKDKIIAKVKEAINKEVNAKVDFKDVDISILRHFPKISVKLEGLSVDGVNEFDGVRLLSTEGLDLALNFWSVWNGGNPYEVNSIYLDRPYINIIALANGKANYDITKPTPPSEPTNFKMSLEHYEINKGTFIYDDRGLNYYMSLRGIDHSGSGEMTADVYDLDTKSMVDSTTVSYGGVKYLSNAKAKLNTIVNADMKNMKFTLKNTDAKVNDLVLQLDGWTQLKDEDILMDLNFKAPSNNFKDFLSLIPAAYTANYSDVKANGRFDFHGFVKGKYNDKTYPSFEITTNIENGSFQYPKLPMGATDINTNITVALPTSNYDDLKVDVPQFKIKLGQNPFEAVFHLRTPVSDPNVDLKANGVINLADLPKALPMEDVQNLSGVITADMKVRTLLSYIEKKLYDKIDMAGAMKVNNMNVQMKGYPSVVINDLAMKFTPNFVGVDNFNAKLGKSDIQASGKIDNILAYFSPNKTMTGDIKMSSSYFDANEWMTPAPANANAAVSSKSPKDTTRPFDRFNFTLNGKMDKIVYEKYEILNSAASGNFTPNRFIINNFQTKIGNSDVSGSGTLVGAYDWMFDNKTLTGNLNLNSNMMDLNQFMTENPQPASSTTANVATEPILVPENVDVTVNANMKRVLYTNMDLSNVVGKLVVANQEVRIDDASANIFGGRTDISGGYNTQDKNKPIFKMAMDLKNIDFKQSFNTLNTFQKLAPIGQYLSGKFNTTIDMNGALGKDLMPDLTTFNLNGFIQTLQGVLTGLKPLEEVANKLNISELKNLDLKETKNWIEVKNGFVTVKEFDKKVKDITLTIAGAHSLTNEMDYNIKAKVPRKLLEKNAVGQAANSAFNNLVTEASKYGVNIKNSEFVNVLFNLKGSMTQPKVTMKVMSGDGQTTLEDAAKATVQATVEKAKDSLTNRANEELDKAKQKANEVMNKAVDSATNVANREIEKAKEKAVEEAKKKATEVLDKQVGDKVGEKVGQKANEVLDKVGADKKAKEQVDKVKDKLDKWDPFGKKKKNTEGEVKKDTGGN